ncbi:MAG: hypothetical protein MUF49_07000 [Oculatellaceae cyanobacterium Prado106]|nr:hypothetical protein [Oculatellaceae cyanobacterium Prado106]
MAAAIVDRSGGSIGHIELFSDRIYELEDRIYELEWGDRLIPNAAKCTPFTDRFGEHSLREAS